MKKIYKKSKICTTVKLPWEKKKKRTLLYDNLVKTGLILSLLDVLRLRKFALYLEDLFGGRVGYLSTANQRESDPFIMLVHHRHTVCTYVYFIYMCTRIILLYARARMRTTDTRYVYYV